jgi:hypothetical protein
MRPTNMQRVFFIVIFIYYDAFDCLLIFRCSCSPRTRRPPIRLANDAFNADNLSTDYGIRYFGRMYF